MNQANGNVTNVFQENRTARSGKSFSIWIVELDTGERFENGFDKPSFQIGDAVSFNWELKYGKPTIASGGSGMQNKPAAGGNKQGGYGGNKSGNYGKDKPFPLPKNHGDTSIIRQNALTNAREFVCDNMETFDYIADKAGITGSDAYIDYIAERIIEIAYKFAEFSSGQREERIAKETMNAPIGQQQSNV